MKKGELRRSIIDLRKKRIDDDFIKRKFLELGVEESLIDETLEETKSFSSKGFDLVLSFFAKYFYLYTTGIFIFLVIYWFLFDTGSFVSIVPSLVLFLFYSFFIASVLHWFLRGYRARIKQDVSSFKESLIVGFFLSAFLVFAGTPIFLVDAIITSIFLYLLLTSIYSLTWREVYPMLFAIFIMSSFLSIFLEALYFGLAYLFLLLV